MIRLLNKQSDTVLFMNNFSTAIQWAVRSDAILGLTPAELQQFKVWLSSAKMKIASIFNNIGQFSFCGILLVAFLPLNQEPVLLVIVIGLLPAIIFGVDWALERSCKLLRPVGEDLTLVSRLQTTCDGSTWAKTMRDSLLQDGHKLCVHHIRLIERHACLQRAAELENK